MTKGRCQTDGCDRPHAAKGLCGAHYQRNRRHGDPLAGGPPKFLGTDLERLAHYSKLDPETGCIEWTGPRLPKGYGLITDGSGKNVYAHRVALSARGVDVEGRVVRHLVCDNPPCVNPEHLAVGTYAENNADRYRKGRHLRGLGLAGRHAVYVEYTIRRPGEPGVAHSLARKYGLSYGVILKYVREQRREHA